MDAALVGVGLFLLACWLLLRSWWARGRVPMNLVCAQCGYAVAASATGVSLMELHQGEHGEGGKA